MIININYLLLLLLIIIIIILDHKLLSAFLLWQE